MSAQVTLAALFPPSGDQIWNENLAWNPIPIHTTPESQDYFLGARKRCDRFDYEMNNFINSTAYTDLFVKYEKLIKYLEKHSGISYTKEKTLNDIPFLYDTLSIEKTRGYRCVQFQNFFSDFFSIVFMMSFFNIQSSRVGPTRAEFENVQ